MAKGALHAMLAVSLMAAGAVQARPGHHHHHYARPRFVTSVYVPVYSVPRYYYPAPVYVAPPPAPVYIEQPQAVPPPASSQAWWYYCPQYRAYYPQVQSCPGPWQRVAPQPPPG